jgi:hypothetical protein
MPEASQYGPVAAVIMIVIISLMVGIGQYTNVTVLNAIPRTDNTTNETIDNIKEQSANAFNLTLVIPIVLAAVSIILVILILPRVMSGL